MSRMGRNLSTEVAGKAAKSLGQFYVPSNGSITAKISGDILHTTLTSGMEKKELFMRIQNIDNIEVAESPIYALMGLGISIVLSGLGALAKNTTMGLFLLTLGIGLIVWSIVKKRRLMVVHSLRGVVPMYMNTSPEAYQQFAKKLMGMARQLNAPAQPQMQQRQNRQGKGGQRRAQSAG
ncbi:MAG: hypothetical protein AAFR25_08385, partial [Cyanobacteria bacterium J06629_19]